ncbi:MAG: septum formation initiator family protein [Alphaproteobacteria bacterium]|nr:septum formation initiator family protein [Alphaproteobacteria bacterium]
MRFIPTFSESRFTLSRRAAGPLLCVLMMFYLGFHAVSGERGLFALFKETRKLELLTAELNGIRENRAEMEKKIKLMSNNSLDLDMLDERARTVLGLAGKDEVVLFTAPK